MSKALRTGGQLFRHSFVLMQFNDTYGFRRGDQLQPASANPELGRDGLALQAVTEDPYENRLFSAGTGH